MMKVESLSSYPIRIKARERLRGGTFSYSYYQTVLVKATVDGVDGWGEAMTRSDPRATALLVDHLAKGLVAKEFDEPSDAWEAIWRELRVRGHTRGTDVEAASGIEIALYDCAGKIRKTPLGRLFSKTPEARVPAFAGSIFESRGPLEGQVALAKGLGLIGAKVKVGFGVEKDRKVLEAVRKLWPGGMLVADANGAYDGPAAARACRAFSTLDLAWFEEPVLSDDLAGYASLRGSKVKIGAGESWFAGDFDDPLSRGLVDVVEPSVSRCGGFRVEVDVARRAAAKGIGFSPMTGMNSAVSLAASLQAASVVRSVGVEYNPFPNPLQTELAAGLDEPSGGSLVVPSGPGLGIRVDERFVKANSG
jgi:L-alanine-DL-glutamate epimerase-like enolase superfamily enzyme